MEGRVEREIVRAMGEVIPVGELRWVTKVARIAAERIEAADRAEEVVAAEAARAEDGLIVYVPREIIEEWGRRAAAIDESIEAAISGSIGVDDDMLGDLIETLDLCSKHVAWLRGVAAPSFSVIPSALAPST